MFHPNIYTQKTTAFQKNCGFSVPLISQGFSGRGSKVRPHHVFTTCFCQKLKSLKTAR